MARDSSALVWIDLEMTGLDPDADRIIEIATIITDSQLNVLGEGPVLAIYQPERVLVGMDQWNKTTHSETGLIDKVRRSEVTEAEAEAQTLEFVERYVPRNRSPLCGNSVCQDRRFMSRHMPKLESYLHYRNLDVSSLKELARRWSPDLYNGLRKKNTHRALDDIRESIQELRYYRANFLKLG